MRKIAFAFIVSCCVSGFLFGEATEAKFRKIELENAGFTIPAENGVIGWKVASRDWPGKMEVREEKEGGNCLVITALPSPTQKDKEGKPKEEVLVKSSPDFDMKIGDQVKVSFEYRINDSDTSANPILFGPRLSQWLPGLKKGKTDGWVKYSAVYTLKELRDQVKEGKYAFGFNVWNGPFEVRNIVVAVQRQEN